MCMSMISERPYSFASLASICLIYKHGLTIVYCNHTEIQIDHKLRDFQLERKIALDFAMIFWTTTSNPSTDWYFGHITIYRSNFIT